MTKPFTSVWTREPRKPKNSGLSREQIVAAAVELLDAEGLDALSMRKLGAKLGAGATSVYWYVANKDELLELAVDEIWALVEFPDPEHTPWREAFSTFAYSLRTSLLAHPWAALLMGQLPMVGPKSFALTDMMRRGATHAGFTGTDIYLASGTVMSFVLGTVLPDASQMKATGGKRYSPESMATMLDQVAAPYPQLRADYRDTLPSDPGVARAIGFDFGLLCVLDGLEARLRVTAVESPAARTDRPVS
ncbi:TetR/AcrR family transcriptional regulator C-terminal domain-containing protein [Nocardia alni]|uniref:TetR/AcrR family transcriptional regulator C-terminal domain-containing protein n=1 Tax=Nocardia alni TaxID=2815723 RepID=UPI001C21D39E|nr:TetR/AcrR family transcriptional regulator C-terminal domain-containing protein [Nocardia alni]